MDYKNKAIKIRNTTIYQHYNLMIDYYYPILFTFGV